MLASLMPSPYPTSLKHYPSYTASTRRRKKPVCESCVTIRERIVRPLVFTTTGGMAPEAKRFIKKLATMMSAKTKEDYSQAISSIT